MLKKIKNPTNSRPDWWQSIFSKVAEIPTVCLFMWIEFAVLPRTVWMPNSRKVNNLLYKKFLAVQKNRGLWKGDALTSEQQRKHFHSGDQFITSQWATGHPWRDTALETLWPGVHLAQPRPESPVLLPRLFCFQRMDFVNLLGTIISWAVLMSSEEEVKSPALRQEGLGNSRPGESARSRSHGRRESSTVATPLALGPEPCGPALSSCLRHFMMSSRRGVPAPLRTPESNGHTHTHIPIQMSKWYISHFEYNFRVSQTSLGPQWILYWGL